MKRLRSDTKCFSVNRHTDQSIDRIVNFLVRFCGRFMLGNSDWYWYIEEFATFTVMSGRTVSDTSTFNMVSNQLPFPPTWCGRQKIRTTDEKRTNEECFTRNFGKDLFRNLKKHMISIKSSVRQYHIFWTIVRVNLFLKICPVSKRQRHVSDRWFWDEVSKCDQSGGRQNRSRVPRKLSPTGQGTWICVSWRLYTDGEYWVWFVQVWHYWHYQNV